MAAQGISGVGLAMATGGALLVYAGFRGISPLTAIREIASGSPRPVANRSADLSGLPSQQQSSSADGDGSVIPASASTSSLVNAAMKFRGDKYSQGKRWQDGYSDCSSFVGKALKSIGIKPPGGSTTTSYLASSQWKKIGRSQAQAGDLAVTTAHMAIFVSNDQAIGQQNPRRNVVIGPVSDIMYPQGNSFTTLRYVGNRKAEA